MRNTDAYKGDSCGYTTFVLIRSQFLPKGNPRK